MEVYIVCNISAIKNQSEVLEVLNYSYKDNLNKIVPADTIFVLQHIVQNICKNNNK